MLTNVFLIKKTYKKFLIFDFFYACFCNVLKLINQNGTMNTTNIFVNLSSIIVCDPNFTLKKTFSIVLTLDSSSINQTRYQIRSIRTRTRHFLFR